MFVSLQEPDYGHHHVCGGGGVVVVGMLQIWSGL
jgi:hypothetical protein